MEIYSISDLHLSINSNKPMDIFGPVWENSFEKIQEFVKKELGIGFATKQYIQEYLDNNELVEIKVNFNIEKRHINGVYRNTNNPKVKNFIKLLQTNINNKY